MTRTILVTGATDGIGLLTAQKLAASGHHLLIHGRNAEKLANVKVDLDGLGSGIVETYQADLSDFGEVSTLADLVNSNYDHLDVVINNAGVFRTSAPITRDNLDVRFVVNTLSPYLLTRRLLKLMDSKGRVINLSSAAQAPVDLQAMRGEYPIEDEMSAYAQSKLGITMWSRHLARQTDKQGPVIIAVNPASLLASKMVKEGFGVDGKDLNIGADILVNLGLEDEFSDNTGCYYDNDIGRFSNPHPDALDDSKCEALVSTMNTMLAQYEL